MTRAEMRLLLRDRVRDTNTVYPRWSDQVMDLQLDASAQFKCMLLDESSEIGFARREVIVTATAREVLLYGVTDYHSPITLMFAQPASGPGPRWVHEKSSNRRNRYSATGKDDEGSFLYWIKYQPTDKIRLTIAGGAGGDTFKLNVGGQVSAAIAYSANAATIQAALQALSTIGANNLLVTADATTPQVFFLEYTAALRDVGMPAMTASNIGAGITSIGLDLARYSLVFLQTPPSGQYLFAYNSVVPSIPTGASGDVHSYTMPPNQFHEQVVAHAAAVLLGYDNSSTGQFGVQWSAMLDELMIKTSRTKPDPARTGT